MVERSARGLQSFHLQSYQTTAHRSFHSYKRRKLRGVRNERNLQGATKTRRTISRIDTCDYQSCAIGRVGGGLCQSKFMIAGPGAIWAKAVLTQRRRGCAEARRE